MDAHGLMGILSVSAITAGIILGSLIILAVIWRYYKYGEINLPVLMFVALGVALLGLSIWKTVNITLSKDKIEMIFQKEARADKRDIYTYYGQQMSRLEGTINKLRSENMILRNKLDQSGTDLTTLSVVYGRIVSGKNLGLADAKVEVSGGSQVFSNSNGEFSIISRPGQTITIRKPGFKANALTVRPEHFENYQNFVLAKEE